MKRALSLILVAAMLIAAIFTLSSCGKEESLNFGSDILTVGSQLEALQGLKKGDADIAVIDSVMAGYYLNDTDEFKDYEVLKNVAFTEEKYGIAAKKGNDAMISKINEALIALADTDYKTIADTYGLTSELLITSSTQNPLADADDGSWDKIVNDKKIVIGYTLFAPIAYNKGDGADQELIGFDIELAKACIRYLNATYSTEIAEPEFIVIDWNQKESLLETGSIDLVWNGMTITSAREEGMSVSLPYLANKQVAIIAKADADKFACDSYEEFVSKASDAIVIVEKGSAGEGVVVPAEEE